MDIISYDPYTDTLERGKTELFPNTLKTYNKVNWGQLAMDLLEENRKTIEEIKKKKKFPLLQEHHIKETFYADNIERTIWKIDTNIPIFTKDRNYIERFIYIEKKGE